MTLKMTTAQVVEMSVTVTNSSFQNYTHPDDHTTRTTDTPGFKPFTRLVESFNNQKKICTITSDTLVLDAFKSKYITIYLY